MLELSVKDYKAAMIKNALASYYAFSLKEMKKIELKNVITEIKNPIGGVNNKVG